MHQCLAPHTSPPSTSNTDDFMYCSSDLFWCTTKISGLKLKEICKLGEFRKFVSFLPDHQFSNGCHAPPWQQVHGDISYLDVKPFDTDKLTITANTAGYFLNKGLTQEGQVNYEREGEVYPTLVALLKAKSPQFASAIDKKVLLYFSKYCHVLHGNSYIYYEGRVLSLP